MSSAICFNLVTSKIMSSGNVLRQTTNQEHFKLFPKLKEFADDNFEFYENGGKLPEKKQQKNAVGKGEIAS